jgi:hypothetical protein
MAATRFKTWALVATAVFGWVLFFIAIGLQRRDDVLVRRVQASQANSWAELQNLRKATGLLASIKTTIDSANQELRQASADRDDAQAEANQARQRIAELRRETNEVEQAIKARRQELAGLQQESETARQQTIEAQAELQRLQELATAKAAESNRSEQLVQAAQVRKGALDAELSRGDMRLAVLDRERAELEQALTELRSDRSTRASELQTISRQREVLQNENAGLADVLAAKKREAVELENRSHSTPQEADAKPKLDEVRFVPQDTVAARSPPDEEPDLRSEKLQSDSSASIAIPLPPPRPEGPIAPQERNPDHTGASLKDSVASSQTKLGAGYQAPLPSPGTAGQHQGNPVSTSPHPADPDSDATVASGSVLPPRYTAGVPNTPAGREQAAVKLAWAYLDAWSSPNRVSLASTSAFYGPSVVFHGRERSYDSVFAEKQRFAERWPERTYRYRPEFTQVACEADGASCTVWSLFDFSAVDRQGRRARGLGEHELVVSFAGDRPVIVAETSRVLRQGAVPRH